MNPASDVESNNVNYTLLLVLIWKYHSSKFLWQVQFFGAIHVNSQTIIRFLCTGSYYSLVVIQAPGI
jgi:hypothetical protein